MGNAKISLPKYLRISREVIATIVNGEVKAGDFALSENEIISKYGVSNTTARKALQEVEREGWVRRVKGKGTIVQENRVGRSMNRVLGFTRNMVEAGRIPSTRLLDVQKRHTGRSLDINGRRVTLPGPMFVIERLRLADGVPIMEETRYISAAVCPDLDKKDLEHSLYDIYEKDYGLVLTEVIQTLSTILIRHSRLMDLLVLQEPTPAFLVEGASFCGRDVIVEMEESLYRGDKYQFNVVARR